MRIDISLIKEELEKTKRRFIEICPMCDAYKTEAQNRRHNQIISSKVRYLSDIIEGYDNLSDEEWNQANTAFYYGYLLIHKETGKRNLLYKKEGDKLFLLSSLKEEWRDKNGTYCRFRNDFTKEELKAMYNKGKRLCVGYIQLVEDNEKNIKYETSYIERNIYKKKEFDVFEKDCYNKVKDFVKEF